MNETRRIKNQRHIFDSLDSILQSLLVFHFEALNLFVVTFLVVNHNLWVIKDVSCSTKDWI